MKRLPQYDTKREGLIPVLIGFIEVSDEEFERAINLARACAPEVGDGVENYLRYEMWKTNELAEKNLT